MVVSGGVPWTGTLTNYFPLGFEDRKWLPMDLAASTHPRSSLRPGSVPALWPLFRSLAGDWDEDIYYSAGLVFWLPYGIESRFLAQPHFDRRALPKYLWRRLRQYVWPLNGL